MIQYPITLNGTQVRVLEAGTGNRHMIFIHGVGARADRWKNNLEELAVEGFHTYAIDLPGHGFSEKNASIPCTVPEYAALVHSLISQFEEGDVYLVGTSLGGHIAATVTCENPNLIKGLALVGTVGITEIGLERRKRTQDLVGKTSWEAIGQKLHAVLHDDALVTESLQKEEHYINNSKGAAEAFEKVSSYFGNDLDTDVVGNRLKDLVDVIPTVIVWGRQDIGFPLELGESAHQLLDGSHFAIIDNAGHAPYFEKPDAFNQIITQFFANQLGNEQIQGVEIVGN